MPGVEDVGATTSLPFDPILNFSGGTRRPGSGRDPASELIEADHRGVTAGLLRAIDATLVRGRLWDALDDRQGPPVAVIDERLARELWPNEDPIGNYLEHQQYQDGTVTSQVIGVVRHIYQQRLTGPTRGLVFIPYRTAAYEHLSHVVHAGGNPAALTGAIHDAVAAPDSDTGIGNVRSFDDYVEQAMRPTRFIMVLASLFGGLELYFQFTDNSQAAQEFADQDAGLLWEAIQNDDEAAIDQLENAIVYWHDQSETWSAAAAQQQELLVDCLGGGN